MRAVRFCIVVALVLSALNGALPVHAGVLVSPARLEAVVGADGRIPEVTLLNKGPEAVAVHFRLVGGGHDLIGMPRFAEDNVTMEQLAEHIALSPQECVLAAGEIVRVTFQLRWPLQGGLYPALIADIVPLDALQTGVVAVTRVAVPMLLTAAAAGVAEEPVLQAQSLRVTQTSNGAPLQIEVDVHNLGVQHVYTGGKAIIRGPQGEMSEVVLPAVTILPGYARRLSVQWAPPALPQGDYVVQFVPDGAEEAAAQVAMRMVRPYELAMVDMRIEHVAVTHSAPGVVLVETLVANRGNVDGAVELALQLLSADGIVIARDVVEDEIAAASGKRLHSPLQTAGLLPGEYLVQVLVQQQDVWVSAWQEVVEVSAAQLVQR